MFNFAGVVEIFYFFFQAEDGIRDYKVTGVQTCALPISSGANLLPWAAQRYAQWAENDPVSWKERLRNGAIYVIQNNRNPFVDHPEYVAMIFDTTAATAVGNAPRRLGLRQNAPNPFVGRTTIHFDLARADRVSLRVYDLMGRLVRTLARGSLMEAGGHDAS